MHYSVPMYVQHTHTCSNKKIYTSAHTLCKLYVTSVQTMHCTTVHPTYMQYVQNNWFKFF